MMSLSFETENSDCLCEMELEGTREGTSVLKPPDRDSVLTVEIVPTRTRIHDGVGIFGNVRFPRVFFLFLAPRLLPFYRSQGGKS